jgi:predicted RNA-binding Zn ribbon-like protein
MNDEASVPAPALLVRDFVNTREPQVGAESFGSPTELRSWFAERHLLPRDAQLEPADLATAITIREGLRAVLLEHAGHSVDATAVAALNQALADQPLRIRFGDPGYHLVSASRSPMGHAVAQLADAIRQSNEDGTWPRLKVCARDTCRWAFYDASRNQVRRWCSMAGCGNHIKMRRAYAARKSRTQLAAEASDPG